MNSWHSYNMTNRFGKGPCSTQNFFFFFLGPRLWHMEVSRPVFESELQWLAYTTVTSTQDLSLICDLR